MATGIQRQTAVAEGVTYDVAVSIERLEHRVHVASLVLSGETIVALRQDSVDLDEVIDVTVSGLVTALDGLVSHLDVLPETLTLYVNDRATLEDVWPSLSPNTQSALEGLTLRGPNGMSPYIGDFLTTFRALTTANTQTQFQANPLVYCEPLHLVADASVLFSGDDNKHPSSSAIGWYILDDEGAIVALEARSVDGMDPNEAEYLAVTEAVKFAHAIDAHYVQLFVDNQAVTHRLDPLRSRGTGADAGLVAAFHHADIVRISRRQNQFADSFTTLGHKYDLSGWVDACREDESPLDDPRCLGRTVDGSRCQNRVTAYNKACYLHSHLRNKI